MDIQLRVNKKEIKTDVTADELLLDTLRRLGYVSVKSGCYEGECGSCTVWLNGSPMLACKILTVSVQGEEITTLEGVRREADEFSDYLLEEGAEQCGYCSPGFIMVVLAMKRELVNPTEEEIKRYINGNLCRCSGYLGRMRAIRRYMDKENPE